MFYCLLTFSCKMVAQKKPFNTDVPPLWPVSSINHAKGTRSEGLVDALLASIMHSQRGRACVAPGCYFRNGWMMSSVAAGKTLTLTLTSVKPN